MYITNKTSRVAKVEKENIMENTTKLPTNKFIRKETSSLIKVRKAAGLRNNMSLEELVLLEAQRVVSYMENEVSVKIIPDFHFTSNYEFLIFKFTYTAGLTQFDTKQKLFARVGISKEYFEAIAAYGLDEVAIYKELKSVLMQRIEIFLF